MHGREPGDAHSVRDVFEQTPVSTEAEGEGHMVAAACTADTNGTVHLAMLEPAWTSSGSNCALILDEGGVGPGFGPGEQTWEQTG